MRYDIGALSYTQIDIAFPFCESCILHCIMLPPSVTRNTEGLAETLAS